MKNKLGITLVEVIVICVIAASLFFLFVVISADTRKRYSHEAYSSWCKLHQRTDFSYEEWKEARRAGLLDAPKESVPVIVPIYSR